MTVIHVPRPPPPPHKVSARHVEEVVDKLRAREKEVPRRDDRLWTTTMPLPRIVQLVALLVNMQASIGLRINVPLVLGADRHERNGYALRRDGFDDRTSGHGALHGLHACILTGRNDCKYHTSRDDRNKHAMIAMIATNTQ